MVGLEAASEVGCRWAVGLGATRLVVAPRVVALVVVWAQAAAWGLPLAQPRALAATRSLAQAMAAEPLGAPVPVALEPAMTHFVQQRPTVAWAWEPLGALAVLGLLRRSRADGVRK